MNDLLSAVIIGIVQGITEFLPVSSSAHLIVVSALLDGKPMPIYLNIALHVGTLSAVLLYFWRDWLALLRGVILTLKTRTLNPTTRVFLPALMIGSIPAGLLGILGQDYIEATFHHPAFVIGTLAFFGILIWWGDKKAPVTKSLDQLSLRDGFLIGCAQALALLPGVSRSGSTILGGRLLGYERIDAARFSFLLGTPAMAGAALLNSKEILASRSEPAFYLGSVCAMIVGCLTIKFLLAFLRRFGFGAFAVYRLCLAAVLLWATTNGYLIN